MDKFIIRLDDLFRVITKYINITVGYSYTTKTGTKIGKIYENGKVVTMKK